MLCAMRAIVRVISLVVATLLVSCGAEVESGMRGEVSVAYLWSLLSDNSVLMTNDISIRGYVVANDRLSELTKSFVMADATGGVAVKVDTRCVDDIVPLYSEVVLYLSGLYLGREGARVVVGTAPTGQYTVDRIAEEEVLNRVKIISVGDTPPLAEPTMLCDISYDDIYKYVLLEGIWPVGEEQELRWCDIDAETGRYITTVRYFTDGTDTIGIVTSGDCVYCGERLPMTKVRLAGIVDVFGSEVVFRITNHQVAEME